MRYKTLEDIINETKYPTQEDKKQEEQEKKIEIKEDPINMQVEYKSKDGIVLIKGEPQDTPQVEEVEDIDIRKKIIISEIESEIGSISEDDIKPKSK